MDWFTHADRRHSARLRSSPEQPLHEIVDAQDEKPERQHDRIVALIGRKQKPSGRQLIAKQ
jgi:hypothetical protein